MRQRVGASSKVEVREIPFISPWEILDRWPEDSPICFLGGAMGFAILALDFYEVSLAEFCQRPIRQDSSLPETPCRFTGGYIGLLSYDEFDLAPHQQAAKPSRVFRVDSALVFYQEKKRLA